jgi:fatty-acyl-CoA synthase
MKTNFSNHFQILADTYGDCEALVNVERNRRFSYRELHLLTNQIVNIMRDSLSMMAGDFFSISSKTTILP